MGPLMLTGAEEKGLARQRLTLSKNHPLQQPIPPLEPQHGILANLDAGPSQLFFLFRR